MYCIKTSSSFDSAHFLKDYPGKCANIHGHRWTIEATVSGSDLHLEGTKRGMLIDFNDLKKAVHSLADNFDHALIYEKNSLMTSTLTALENEGFNLIEVPFRPTAENFAKYFYDLLFKDGLTVSSVTVYETPENCAIYSGRELLK